MSILDVLNEKSAGVSFEFFPPKTEKGRNNLMAAADELKKHAPAFVSVTYGAGGGNRETAVASALALHGRGDLTVMPHVTCIGTPAADLDGIFDTYVKNGIENILALRGDPPAGMENFDVSAGDFGHASDMISYLGREYPFACAAAAYPEGHFEAASLEEDIANTKKKVEAGARLLITQMFFENSHFYDFRERLEKAGIHVPVLPGIMPVLNFSRIKELAVNYAKVEIPKKMSDLLEPLAGNRDDTIKAGIEYAVSQCEDLKKNGVTFFHFFVLNKARSAGEIIRAAGLALPAGGPG